jgi:hypothetical protein
MMKVVMMVVLVFCVLKCLKFRCNDGGSNDGIVIMVVVMMVVGADNDNGGDDGGSCILVHRFLNFRW